MKGYVPLMPNSVPDSHRAIAEEAERIHESALFSAQGQFEQAKLWRLINLIIGVPAAILGAIAGGTSLAGSEWGNWPGYLALTAAALTATLTTVNASRRMTQAQSSGNAYLQLQTQARQFLAIDLVDMPKEDARTILQNLTNSRDELNKTADPPGRIAYWRAKRNISRGGQRYAVDREGSQ
ncbi:SLATT domain-containing protein [Streptomyces adonidis]|uniref:SLATT domain-containing protein n=1 Tax=Streptomyces adonidis TaxID=3231367 RepID=UPI0034DB163F